MATHRLHLAATLGALIWLAMGGSVGHAGMPGDVVAISSVDISELRKEQRAEIVLCRQILRHRASPGSFLEISDLRESRISRTAQRIWYGDGCRQDRSLAIQIMDYVVGPEPLKAASGDPIGQLATYLSERSEPGDIDWSMELRRMMWLRGDIYSSLPPIQWSPADLRAFLARQDVWAYLNRQEKGWGSRQDDLLFTALSDLESPRFDRERSVALAESSGASPQQKLRAAQLLLPAAEGSESANRAEALLTAAASYSEEARSLFSDLILPRLASPEPAVRDKAVAHLSAWSTLQTPSGAAARVALTPLVARDLSLPGDEVEAKAVATLADFVIRGTKEAELPLLHWMEWALREGDSRLKQLALTETARLIAEGSPLGRRILNTELDRNGGLVNAGSVSREQGNLARVFAGDHYPNASLRAQEEGVLEAAAILSPEGVVIAVIVTHSASPSLDKAAEKILLRDARGIRPPGLSGRYVQVQLPPIQFMLKECQKDSPADPVIPGALLMQPTPCPQSSPVSSHR